MGRGTNLLMCLALITGASSLQYVESELESLPKHFHLDDYEKCLDRPDGVFCLGQFQVYSEVEDHPTFELIKKYSQDPYLFNRTYLHRGYCLTTRCAGTDANLTARFESCVDKWAQDRHGLRVRLLKLKYCKEHGKPLANAPETQDLPHRVFLYVVFALLALNVIGTIYDLNVDGKGKDNKLLRMWSIRHNWNKLTAPPHPDGERNLAALNGIKTIMSFGPIYLHANILLAAVYQQNPRAMEKFLYGVPGPMVSAFTTITQANVVISNFLTAYMVLSIPDISFKKLPLLVMKRIIRIFPVYLLTIAYAATWWTSAGEGPMWHIVEGESAICKSKYGIMALFLQNVVDPQNICLVQTWIMAVDMQVHIPVLVLSCALKRCRRWALPVIGALFAVALALTTHLAFDRGYVPAYTYMTPQTFNECFFNVKSFNYFFLTPANCMMSVTISLWIAFYHKDLQERGVNLTEKKGLVFLFYTSFIGIFVWCYCCYYFRDFADPNLVMAMIPIERLVCCFLMGSSFILMMNVECRLSWFLRWHNFTIISRMALSIAMVHWCINGIIIGNRYTAYEFTTINYLLDAFGTFVASYIVALPLTLLVDFPMKQTLNLILF